MRDYLLQLKTQVVELWNKLTRNQKIIIVASALFLVGTLAFLVRGASQPDFAPLFTQLDPQDAGKTVEWLNENKIDYMLAEGGTTILVPSKDVDSTRIALSSEGFPTGGVVGFEAFEETNFGETETDRRARFVRALQGELTRTIERFSEVDKARVHIVLPEPSLFLEEQKTTTAAVWLKLKSLKTLEPEQVKGLVSLVANSVEGLDPKNVTVVDMNGNILSGDLDFSADNQRQKLTLNQMELQNQYQNRLQQDLQSMLEKVVGIGKAVVRVRAELDFDQTEQTKKDFGEKHLISESKKEQSSSSTNAVADNGAGEDANIEVPGYAEQTESSGESTSSEIIRNYDYDQELINTKVAPGKVKKLSVSVVIDKAIDGQEQQDIQQAVIGAAGIDENRGDVISVIGIPFNTDYQKEMEAEFAQAERKQNIITLAAIGAVLLLVIIGFIVWSRKRKAEEQEEAEEFVTNPLPLMEVEELMNMEPEQELSPEEKEKVRIKEQVEKVAKDNPGDVAQLLKTWLIEE